VFIRRTDGESLAQIRAEKANPRADIYHAAESASAKQLAAEGLLEAYKSPRIAELHDWAQRIARTTSTSRRPSTRACWAGATTRAPREEEIA
jgi:ABC-type Fe3+ transport system substrate-binding protein